MGLGWRPPGFGLVRKRRPRRDRGLVDDLVGGDGGANTHHGKLGRQVDKFAKTKGQREASRKRLRRTSLQSGIFIPQTRIPFQIRTAVDLQGKEKASAASPPPFCPFYAWGDVSSFFDKRAAVLFLFDGCSILRWISWLKRWTNVRRTAATTVRHPFPCPFPNALECMPVASKGGMPFP